MKVKVVVDMREEELWGMLAAWEDKESAAVKADGWCVEKRALDVGDIAFYVLNSEGEEKEAVLVERKTAEDLGASQRDGRYREQRTRLLAKRGGGTSIGYILEAPTWSPTLSRTWCRGAFSELHLQNAILRLQMRYTIPVFQAASLKETTQWIRRIATALCGDPTVFQTGLATSQKEVAASYTESIHVKKAANMDEDRVLTSLLRVLPGVGVTAADAIVKHTKGSFPAFFALTPEEIAILSMGDGKRKIGKVLATKIWNIFHISKKDEDTKTESAAENSKESEDA